MGDILITGEVAMQHAEVARLVGALSAECRGMKVSRRSEIQQAAKWSGSGKRTAKGALEDLLVWYYGQGGTINALWGSVARGLGDERVSKLKRKCLKASPIAQARMEAAK
jgi:hypothetical protein